MSGLCTLQGLRGLILLVDLVMFATFLGLAFTDAVVPGSKKFVDVTREFTAGNGTRVVQKIGDANIVLLASMYFAFDFLLTGYVYWQASRKRSPDPNNKWLDQSFEISLKFLLAYLFSILGLCVVTGQTDVFKIVLFVTVAAASHMFFVLVHYVPTDNRVVLYLCGLVFAILPWALFVSAIAISRGSDTKYQWALVGLFAGYFVVMSIYTGFANLTRIDTATVYTPVSNGSSRSDRVVLPVKNSLWQGFMELVTNAYQVVFAVLLITIIR